MGSAVHLDDHTHDLGDGWLRPAVFGAMDGLVSNAALVAGVAGGTAGASGRADAILLAGLAGLAAGAFSMAAGEYVSVASDSESKEREVERERNAIEQNPDGERGELRAMLIERGLDPELADDVAEQVHDDLDTAVLVHSQLEFGVDPDELNSPTLAAASSFAAFSVGALVPLVPFLVGVGGLVASMLVTLVALFGCGAMVTRYTGRSWWFGGGRQVLLGAVAFVATYGIGTLVGTQV